MAIPIGIQMYTLRDLAAKDWVQAFKTVAEIGYVGVEFAGLYKRPAKEVNRVVKDLGLKPVAAHVGVTDPKNWAQIEDEAEELGYKILVSPYLPPAEYESEEKVRANAEKFNAAINHFAPKGYKVALHNHDWEYSGPNKGDLLLSLAPRCCLEVDIYWVKVGGADPAELIRRYGTRTPLLHVKDGPGDKAKAMLPSGKGVIDIPSAVRAAEYVGAEYLVVELDRCDTDMVEAVRESYNYLTRRSLAKGNR